MMDDTIWMLDEDELRDQELIFTPSYSLMPAVHAPWWRTSRLVA